MDRAGPAAPPRDPRQPVPGRLRRAPHRDQVRTVGVTVRATEVHYVRPGQLERTSGGKLRRRAVAEAPPGG